MTLSLSSSETHSGLFQFYQKKSPLPKPSWPPALSPWCHQHFPSLASCKHPVMEVQTAVGS